MEQDNTLDLGKVTGVTEATDEFVEITLPEKEPAPHKKKRRWPWLVFSLVALLGLAAGILTFLYSSQGQASPQALTETYAAALSDGNTGQIYRLFPDVIQRRWNGSRADLILELDEFAFAYGRIGHWSILSTSDYTEADRSSFSSILNTDITHYQEVILETVIDDRIRRLHLDVIEIEGEWYLAQVWNDDILPGIGFAQPEEAIDAYLSAFTANNFDGMAAALSPALAQSAIEKGYGLRSMLCEIDDFTAVGLSGQPVSYTITQTKDYSAYQAQSMAEILGVQPQAYRAYHLEAVIGDTVYTAVFDLARLDDRWGITAVWDYNKSYII